MKLLFIDPPVLIGKRTSERVFGCTYSLYPIPNIFLLQCAAVLIEKGCCVEYKNMPLDKIDKKGFVEFLKKDRSDVYCIYSVNLARQIDLEAVRIIREIRGCKKVVFFGPAPTYAPDDYLTDEDVVVIRGEPEMAFTELVEAIKDGKGYDGIKGVSFLYDGKVFNMPARAVNVDIDSLPVPARELVDTDKYFNPKFRSGKFTAMLTSRGCPYNCKFCVPCSLSFARELEQKKAFGRKPRYVARSAKSVIDEFMTLVKQGYTGVSILDDEFLIDKKRVMDICDGIKGFGLSWSCLARADGLDEKIVKAMAEAGCKCVDIGVESFCQRILDDIRKNLRVETVGKAVGLTKKYGIFTKINILFGSSPMESKETIKETLRNIRVLRPDSVMFGVCNPFPGTEYYDIAKENGWFVKGDYYPIDVQKESTINLPKISKNELELFVRKANAGFFLNYKFIIKNISRVKTPKELLNNVTALMKKLF